MPRDMSFMKDHIESKKEGTFIDKEEVEEEGQKKYKVPSVDSITKKRRTDKRTKNLIDKDKESSIAYYATKPWIELRRQLVARCLRAGLRPTATVKVVNAKLEDIKAELKEMPEVTEDDIDEVKPVTLYVVKKDSVIIRKAWREIFKEDQEQIGAELADGMKQALYKMVNIMEESDDDKTKIMAAQQYTKSVEALAKIFGIWQQPSLVVGKIEQKTEVKVIGGEMPKRETVDTVAEIVTEPPQIEANL